MRNLFFMLTLIMLNGSGCQKYVSGPEDQAFTIESENYMQPPEIFLSALAESQKKNYEKIYPEPMLPPWLQFPEIPRYSIGWRMGEGDDYNQIFGDWFYKLSKKKRENYILENPEPKEWEGKYNSIIDVREKK